MSDTRRMDPADVPDDLAQQAEEAWKASGHVFLDRVVRSVLAAVLPEYEQQVRKKVAEEQSAERPADWSECLDEIETRANAATPGPWSAYDDDPEHGRLFHYGDFGWTVRGPAGTPEVEDSEQGKADAAFIAHAREDIPLLLRIARGETS
jgi:hypothetical protein